MEKQVALVVYPHFSVQEVANLSALFRWYFDSKTVVFSSGLEPVTSEEGIRVLPEKTFRDFSKADFDCLILPGCSDARASINDASLIQFLQSFKGDDRFVIGAIGSGPMYLARAGVLVDRKFSASLFVEMYQRYAFVEEENVVYAPLTVDGNIVTAAGEAYQEFAIAVARAVGHECSDKAYQGIPADWTEEDFKHHLTPEGIAQFEEAFADLLLP